jgi:hypothetical protein
MAQLDLGRKTHNVSRHCPQHGRERSDNVIHTTCSALVVLISVLVLREGLTMRRKKNDSLFWFWKLLYASYCLYSLFCRLVLSLKHWNCKNKRITRYNCLVLGQTKYRGHCVQQVYCNPYSEKPFYGSRRVDLVMISPQGIDSKAFVVSPDTVWYARVLLLFSASAMTDTGFKSFDCALVSTLETSSWYEDPENGSYVNHYINYIHYLYYCT